MRPMQLVACEADVAEERCEPIPDALLQTVERRSLRVRVDQRDAPALPTPGACEVHGEHRLADAALLFEEGDDHRALARFANREA